MKGYENALSHYQSVALIFVELLCEPALVLLLLSFMRDAELDDARKYHQKMRRSFIAFGGVKQNNENIYDDLQYSLAFFRPGFLNKLLPQRDPFVHANHINMKIKEKVRSVNLIFDDSIKGDIFRRFYSYRSIGECMDDYQRWDRCCDRHNRSYPHLLIFLSDKDEYGHIGPYIESVW